MSDSQDIAPIQKYTKSAIIDKLTEEFKADKELDKIIYNLQFQTAILTVNPSKYPTLLELCATAPLEVPIYIKDSIIKLLHDYGTPGSAIELVRDRFALKLTFDDTIPLENLSASYENTIIQTVAQIVSVGRWESYIREIHHKCSKCGNFDVSTLPKLVCPDCKTPMDVIKTIYGDTVIAEIQQPYDDTTVQPTPFTAQFFDDDVPTLKIGDLKKLTLIRRSHHKKTSDRRKIILHVISSIDITQKEPKLPDEELKKRFHQLASDPDYIDYLTRSIAPSILYQDLAKLGCMLAIIGGTPQSGVRSIIHAMLCGDPSEGKTSLIKYFCRLPYQKTGYAVGGQASGQGITVAMTKLSDGTSFPRAGVLTLCTDGYVGIDEFNLIKPEDLDKARECMEDGEIHYDKGGFMLNLTANTRILAGMNPRWSFYDFEKSMKDNLNIPQPILSRFDIRINVTTQKDVSKQHRIISHIYNVKSDGVTDYVKQAKLLTDEEISLLINYARTFKPIANEAVRNKLIKFYIKQKELEYNDGTEGRMLRIDNRTGRALLLLSEAFARLHLSNEVTEQHCDMAIKFFKDCLRTFGIDPELGLVQSTLQENTFTPKTAFEEVAIQLERKNLNGHFSEEEITKELLEKFPMHFKHDYQVHDMLDDYYRRGRITSKGGRYKLV